MSKELEAWEKIKNITSSYEQGFHSQLKDDYVYEKEVAIIETALKDYERRLALAKEYKDINNVGKRLKAFEIIKEKDVDVVFVKRYKTVEEYNNAMDYISKNGGDFEEHLTQEEFDLLKEVLL